MEYLRTTFVPPDDPDGSERRTVAGQPVVIYPPKKRIAGLTFVVTAANIPLSKYASTIAALNAQDHVVVGFFVNVLNPLLGNHRAKAQRIREIFDEVKDEFRVNRYDIVGHSVGGKIALLVAALHDEENLIRSIVALDPVDQSPVEFTTEFISAKKSLTNGGAPPQNPFAGGDSSTSDNKGGNLSLETSLADITLTCTDTGPFLRKCHNARAIQKNNPSVKLVMHRNSHHMVYCDDYGLLTWKALTGRGKSADRNKAVRDEAITRVKDRAVQSSSSGVASAAGKKASGKVGSSIANVKKKMKEGVDDVKGMKAEAKKKAGMAAEFSKFMG